MIQGKRKSAEPLTLRLRAMRQSRVGRQYLGEIGKTDNGVVLVTTHLDDGVKSLPLDVELYQHASSLLEGKLDPPFSRRSPPGERGAKLRICQKARSSIKAN